MSDEDSDEQVSKMIEVPEPDSDYLIIEPVEPYERGTSIFKYSQKSNLVTSILVTFGPKK